MLQWWSEDDREALKRLYPAASKDEIMQALNGENRKKTWFAIQKEASRMSIQRTVPRLGRPKKKLKTYVGKNQLKKLMEKDLTLAEIGEKLNAAPEIVRRYVFKYGL